MGGANFLNCGENPPSPSQQKTLHEIKNSNNKSRTRSILIMKFGKWVERLITKVLVKDSYPKINLALEILKNGS